MKGTRILWLSAILASLSACDTRDDYFLEHGEEPVIEMKTSNDTLNSEYWEGKRYRIVNVGLGRPDTLSFTITDPYGKECSYDFDLISLPADNDVNGVYREELLYYFGKDVCKNFIVPSVSKQDAGIKLGGSAIYDTHNDPALKKVKSMNKVIFKLGRKDLDFIQVEDNLKELLRYAGCGSDEDWDNLKDWETYIRVVEDNLLHEIPLTKEVSARYAMTAKNKIGTEATEYVVVKIKPNCQPVPTFSYTCSNKETNEYKISAGGTDPDGHKIVKWSYLFDYTPYKIGSETITGYFDTNSLQKLLDGYLYYDYFVFGTKFSYNVENCFYWSTFGMSKDDVREKKIEADFITPTTKNEVSHVFQSKGEHTISVRCQDEYGLWSDYITEKIYIE